jgi:putative hydrolase of the HAD superfamily
LKTRGERWPEFDMEVVWSTVLQMLGLNSPFLVESCCKLFRLVSRERFQLFSDTLPSLRALKNRGAPLVMLSNAQGVFFFEEVEMLGLKPFFSYFLVSSNWGFRKPDPRLFALACTLCGFPPAEVVYVGDDTDADVKGAESIGMRTVLVDRSQRQKDREPRPDFYTTGLTQAVEWIQSNS